MITVLQLFFGMPIFWVGISLFGYIAYTAPEDCPKNTLWCLSSRSSDNDSLPGLVIKLN